MSDCVFCKIVAGELPASFLYQDEELVLFEDIQPQAPRHLLVVPRTHISGVAALGSEHAALVGHIFAVIAAQAQALGLTEGFRVVTNQGAVAGQTVPHLHFHILGGRVLSTDMG